MLCLKPRNQVFSDLDSFSVQALYIRFDRRKIPHHELIRNSLINAVWQEDIYMSVVMMGCGYCIGRFQEVVKRWREVEGQT